MQRTDSRRPDRVKQGATLTLVVAMLALGVPAHRTTATVQGAGAAQGTDAAASRAAFQEVYKVLMHPRCMNCHPSADAPLQGDDSHPHLQNVQRGKDGNGKYALRCANCHQERNLPGENLPPGNPTWRLPRPEMPLVFQGKSPRALADQLKDPRRNGGKTLQQLVEHVTHDKLVLWGWEPGDGRTKPPLSHDAFVKKVREWVETGAASPE
jgi:hypothetical protein